MKYVPFKCTSVASDAKNNPVKPPMVNSPIKPSAYSIGASYEIEPLYKVAVQLNTLIAEGIATRKLNTEKISPAYTDWPVTNMWWPQTRKLMIAIARLENATKVYPKIRFRENAVINSLITPIPGRIMMYTAGCE